MLLVLSCAAPAVAQVCPLDRSPFLPWVALPDELKCDFDQDGNGLDDAIERQIAACVAPLILFDSGENARLPGEPRTLFTAERVGLDSVLITYIGLFAYDGGYVFSACGNDHPGDFMVVRVKVAIGRQLGTWTAAPVEVSGGDLGTLVAGQDIQLNGSHAVVYASAGKHHQYAEPYQGPAGNYGCNDRAYGDGDAVVLGSDSPLSHVSSTAFLTATLGATAASNLCLLATDPLELDAPADGFQEESLASLGYSGHGLFDSFYGLESP